MSSVACDIAQQLGNAAAMKHTFIQCAQPVILYYSINFKCNSATFYFLLHVFKLIVLIFSECFFEVYCDFTPQHQRCPTSRRYVQPTRYCERKKTLKEVWYQYSLRPKDEVIRIWLPKVRDQGHCDLTEHSWSLLKNS